MSLCHFCHDPKSDVLNDDIVGPLSTIENCCVLSHLEKCVCVCVCSCSTKRHSFFLDFVIYK